MKDIKMLGMELSLERNMDVENESAGSIIPEVEEDDEELDDEEPPRSDVNEAELLKEACCAVDEEEVSSLDDLKSAKLVKGESSKAVGTNAGSCLLREGAVRYISTNLYQKSCAKL